MPHVSVNVGEHAMPTPWSLRESVEISRGISPKTAYISSGQNSMVMLTNVAEIRTSEQGLVTILANEFSRHRQLISV